MLRPDLVPIAARIETAIAGIYAEHEAETLTPTSLRNKLEIILACAATLRIAEDAMRVQGANAATTADVVIDLDDERNHRAVRAFYRVLGFAPVIRAAARLPSDNLRMPTQALWTPGDDGPGAA